MKTIIFLGLITVACAAPKSTEVIPIVAQENNRNPDGSYSYGYESGNGIIVVEIGELKTITNVVAHEKPIDEQPVIVVRGQFSYLSDDGRIIRLRYIADENGFQPSGDHLPSTPSISATTRNPVEPKIPPNTVFKQNILNKLKA